MTNDAGVLFFAHNGGVSVFNGAKWTKLNFNQTGLQQIHALCFTNNNELFIGGKSKIGYFKTDKIGRLIFNDLSHLVKGKIDNYNIFKIVESNGSIIFQSTNKLFIYSNNKIKIIQTKSLYSGLFKVNNTVLVSEKDKGLQVLKGLELAKFKQPDSTLKMMFSDIAPFGKDSMLLTRKNNIYVSPTKTLKLTKINHNFNNTYASKIIKITDNNYLIGLRNVGAISINRQLEIIEIIDKNYGLINEFHTAYCLTKDGNLAIATENGISILNINSRIRKIGVSNNFNGNVEQIKGDNNQIIIMSKEGVHILKDSSISFIKLKVNGYSAYGGGLVKSPKGTQLYLAMDDGVYTKKGNGIKKFNNDYAWTIEQYPFNENYFFIGHEKGVSIYKYTNEQWQLFKNISTHGEVKCIEFDKNGVVWFGTSLGLTKYNPEFNKKLDSKINEVIEIDLKSANIEEGLVWVENFNDKLLLGTVNGVYEINTESNKIIKTTVCGEYVSTNTNQAFRFNVDGNNNLWIEFITDPITHEVGYVDVNGIWHNEEFTSLADGIIYYAYPQLSPKNFVRP